MKLKNKDILDIESLSAEEIGLILDTAERMREVSRRPVKKVPTLRGKTIILFFHEPSTRTKTSFDIAAKRMSADSISMAASSSSLVKGETLADTALTLEAMNPDIIVMRHSSAGAPHMMAQRVNASVINGGDGMHAHPTQALLDMLTIREKLGSIAGKRVAIIGDIAHSRVARSNINGLTKMGASVVVAGPFTMLPYGVAELGCEVATSVDEAVEGADVVMMLRIQKERQENFLFSSVREYSKNYGLTRERLMRANEGAIVMHPGPMNRGVELTSDIADGPWSVILDQVSNGVAARMALFYLLAGGRDADSD
ncbi:aspartate carbamoyltransferase catalytic subunit [Desulfoluna butyratoxydans]|uniref:Aspartate carbamoyltransferase n=1 Tax=Desulfoluna butyratoxydans TaxID=231438 RepID=A0A4U8YTH4_9BACT|nr:aspartate carbamoyltransferase catalytic subunit [Desulfoluna butyratoxydans]VFQ47280.1 aspartate/ornithine carbamoyltransferase [Desulfoluna butyratoxydans]